MFAVVYVYLMLVWLCRLFAGFGDQTWLYKFRYSCSPCS